MHLSTPVCIDLDQPSLPGFRKFISSWLISANGYTVLVDPGPLSTIPHLVNELRRLEVERLDHILLTHIHIDHAGGTGALLAEYPEAMVTCHPEGIRHLVAPEKLWQGSLKVLGKLADAYGEIVPVPEKSIRFEETIEGSGIRAFLTPGHAQHHVSYLHHDLLVAGEVAGVRSDVPDGIFIRPATPPRFMLPVALDSLDRVIALAPRQMIFAHYGMVDDAVRHLQIARQQLLLWLQGIAVTAGAALEMREEALVQWLVEHDPQYRNLALLPEDIRSRERYFLRNTVMGMTEYVASLDAQEREKLEAGVYL